MDDYIPIRVDDPFYKEDPQEQVNRVYRRKSIELNIPISELISR